MVLSPLCNDRSFDGIRICNTGTDCVRVGRAYAYDVGDIAHRICIMKPLLILRLSPAYDGHIVR